jgi:hypothetical protein
MARHLHDISATLKPTGTLGTKGKTGKPLEMAFKDQVIALQANFHVPVVCLWYLWCACCACVVLVVPLVPVIFSVAHDICIQTQTPISQKLQCRRRRRRPFYAGRE